MPRATTCLPACRFGREDKTADDVLIFLSRSLFLSLSLSSSPSLFLHRNLTLAVLPPSNSSNRQRTKVSPESGPCPFD